jgi:hypothetical protein
MEQIQAKPESDYSASACQEYLTKAPIAGTPD